MSMKFLPLPPKKLFGLFPHNTRINSASSIVPSERAILWSLFTLVIGLNVFVSANYDATPWDKLVPIFTGPQSATDHLSLAKTLEYEGRLASADHERAIARDLGGFAVLGATTSIKEKAKLVEFWQQIGALYPGYRDAHLQTAWILTNQERYIEALTAARRALAIDPYSQTAKNLIETLENVQEK